MKTMVVADLMSTEVVTLTEGEDFVSANQIMKLRRFRHLPVVGDGNRLVGLVTHRDLLGAQATLMLALTEAKSGDERDVTVTVGEIMSEVLLTCRPIEPLDDAARLMIDARVGCMLVVEDDELVGILTQTDIMRWAVEMMAKQRFETEPPPKL